MDHEFVQELVDSQLTSFKEQHYFPIVGSTIVLGQCACDQCLQRNRYGLFIIDGQHRLECFRQLVQHCADFALTDLTVSIILVRNDHRFLRQKFVEMGKHTKQISEYYLSSDPKKEIIDALWIRFRQQYSHITTEEGNRPNIGHKDFMDQLSHCSEFDQVIEATEDIQTATKTTYEIFINYNNYLVAHKDALPKDITPKMIEKAFIHLMFLGLIPKCRWIDRAFEYSHRPKIKVASKVTVVTKPKNSSFST